MSEPWQDAYITWAGSDDHRLRLSVQHGFQAGWDARDKEVSQLRAIAERGAIDLDIAAETLLVHPELNWDTFIGTLQRQAQHIRNALTVNVPASETWKEGSP